MSQQMEGSLETPRSGGGGGFGGLLILGAQVEGLLELVLWTSPSKFGAEGFIKCLLELL